MTPDVPGVAAVVQRLGLRPRLRSESGEWVDFVTDDGLLAVHGAETPEFVLAFEAPDVDVVAARFRRRGLRADLVDENYGSSVRIDDPDAGPEIYINETQHDLYGYVRLGGASA